MTFTDYAGYGRTIAARKKSLGKMRVKRLQTLSGLFPPKNWAR